MKFQFDERWLKRKIEQECDLDVAAGSPPGAIGMDELDRRIVSDEEFVEALALRVVARMMRRERIVAPGRLAERFLVAANSTNLPELTDEERAELSRFVARLVPSDGP